MFIRLENPLNRFLACGVYLILLSENLPKYFHAKYKGPSIGQYPRGAGATYHTAEYMPRFTKDHL